MIKVTTLSVSPETKIQEDNLVWISNSHFFRFSHHTNGMSSNPQLRVLWHKAVQFFKNFPLQPSVQVALRLINAIQRIVIGLALDDYVQEQVEGSLFTA